MTDIVIKQEEKKEEKPVETQDIKETLKAADEYKRLKEENDRLETEYVRQQELKAKIAMGGKALAGKVEKTPEDEAKEEAARIISMFR